MEDDNIRWRCSSNSSSDKRRIRFFLSGISRRAGTHQRAYFYNYCRHPLIYVKPDRSSLLLVSVSLCASTEAYLLSKMSQTTGIIASASAIANKLITRCRRAYVCIYVYPCSAVRVCVLYGKVDRKKERKNEKKKTVKWSWFSFKIKHYRSMIYLNETGFHTISLLMLFRSFTYACVIQSIILTDIPTILLIYSMNRRKDNN